MSVFTAVHVDLAKYQKSCDMNIIMWLFSHLACKEVYHIIIFISTACFARSLLVLTLCIMVSYPGSPHTLSLQYETGFVCKCDSIEMRILLDTNKDTALTVQSN